MIFNFLSTLVYFAIAIYLWSSYHRHQRQNQTTKFWSYGFVLIGITQALFLLREEFFIAPWLLYYHFILTFIVTLGLTVILYSTFLLFARRKAWLWLPWIIGAGTLILNVYQFLAKGEIASSLMLFSFLFWTPISLLIAILFFLVFGQMYMAKGSVWKNLGPLLLGLGWLIFGVGAVVFPFVFYEKIISLWFLSRIIAGFLILGGIVLLEKESQEALDGHLQIHGLKRNEKTS